MANENLVWEVCFPWAISDLVLHVMTGNPVIFFSFIKRRAGSSETSREGRAIAEGPRCQAKQLLGMQAPIMVTVRT